MAESINAITGATGLLGSHVAQQLRARGEKVRALIRTTSDVRFLSGLGTELVAGDLDDMSALGKLCDGAGTLYHCAARVGDFGKWKQFRTEVVDATARVMKVAQTAGVARALHVSSVA